MEWAMLSLLRLMSPIRKLLFVGVGVLALYGVQACASETELNPQPLPPGEPARTPDDKNDDQENGGMGAGGTSGSPTSPAPADAADGGSDGGPG